MLFHANYYYYYFILLVDVSDDEESLHPRLQSSPIQSMYVISRFKVCLEVFFQY